MYIAGLCASLLGACSGSQNTSASSAASNSESSSAQNAQYENAHLLQLSETTAKLDGVALEEFDYTWHIDPSQSSEWYEGEEPSTSAAAYIAHDIYYYPLLDEEGFTLQNYDGEQEWVYHYTANGYADYIFSTLPVLGNALPAEMMFSAETAYENKVLHITEPGTYVIEGTWHGQIFVNLGDEDEVFADESMKVTLVLDGVTVTCDCAPALIVNSRL